MKKLLMVIPLGFLLCFIFGCQQGEQRAEEPVMDVQPDIQAIKNIVQAVSSARLWVTSTAQLC